MEKLNVNCISTGEQYDNVRTRVNNLIEDATKLGLLEPGMDNEYLCEIGRLAKMSAEYEDNFMKTIQEEFKELLSLSGEQFEERLQLLKQTRCSEEDKKMLSVALMGEMDNTQKDINKIRETLILNT